MVTLTEGGTRSDYIVVAHPEFALGREAFAVHVSLVSVEEAAFHATNIFAAHIVHKHFQAPSHKNQQALVATAF